MLKKSIETPSSEADFLRRAWKRDFRLDGRRLLDWRDTQIKLARDECRAEADVSIGQTRVIAIVSGQIIKPFQDRPTEGFLQFSAEICMAAENAGFNQSSVCRLVERSIKDSECIDLESLTLIAGEQVWCISCDIRVLSFHGNLNDVTSLAVMSALRAFRKPEVSIVLSEDSSPNLQSFAKNLKLFSEDEREPLPLALHHTPLTVSIGLIHDRHDKVTTTNSNAGKNLGDVIFLTDPAREEEIAVDGQISFSVNSHSEICSIIKPGGLSLSLPAFTNATDIALKRALNVHKRLVNALQQLEDDHAEIKSNRLDRLRKFRVAHAIYNDGRVDVNSAETHNSLSEDGGLNVNDPLLRYNFTHISKGCTVNDKT